MMCCNSLSHISFSPWFCSQVFLFARLVRCIVRGGGGLAVSFSTEHSSQYLTSNCSIRTELRVSRSAGKNPFPFPTCTNAKRCPRFVGDFKSVECPARKVCLRVLSVLYFQLSYFTVCPLLAHDSSVYAVFLFSSLKLSVWTRHLMTIYSPPSHSWWLCSISYHKQSRLLWEEGEIFIFQNSEVRGRYLPLWGQNWALVGGF
jgi:hypothetical protein